MPGGDDAGRHASREHGTASCGSIVLRVDRPFLFAVRDTKTGAILFLGRVTEPATR